MLARDKIEAHFFADGPAFCLKGALCLMATGLALSVLGGFLKPDVPMVQQFWFAGLMAIPAGLLALLSLTIARRHILTIPLVLVLCLFAARFLLVKPEDAMAGIDAGWFFHAVGWIVYFAIIAGILAMVELMWSLWRKGAFK